MGVDSRQHSNQNRTLLNRILESSSRSPVGGERNCDWACQSVAQIGNQALRSAH